MFKAILVLFILLLAVVQGNDYIRYYNHTFDKCENLTIMINGTLPIEQYEYVIMNDYNLTGNNTYFINCEDNFTFLMYFRNNAVNNYTITMADHYSESIQEIHIGGGGSSRRKKTCTPDYECSEWGNCINSFRERVCIDMNNCSENITETEKCQIIQNSSSYQKSNSQKPASKTDQINEDTYLEIPEISYPTTGVNTDSWGSSFFIFMGIILIVAIIVIVYGVVREKKRDYEL